MCSFFIAVSSTRIRSNNWKILIVLKREKTPKSKWIQIGWLLRFSSWLLSHQHRRSSNVSDFIFASEMWYYFLSNCLWCKVTELMWTMNKWTCNMQFNDNDAVDECWISCSLCSLCVFWSEQSEKKIEQNNKHTHEMEIHFVTISTLVISFVRVWDFVCVLFCSYFLLVWVETNSAFRCVCIFSVLKTTYLRFQTNWRQKWNEQFWRIIVK